MKQEDKEVLLKDLCGRLPYGTMTYLQNSIDAFDSEICTLVLEHVINDEYMAKPYLFPFSSMTQKQRAELSMLVDDVEGMFNSFLVEVEFYNKHHFDYRGLIEKGLAIDATGLNIY